MTVPKQPSATELTNQAQRYRGEGKLREAEPLFEQALESDEERFPSDHPDVLRDLHNLADVYYEEGKFKETENTLEKLVAGEQRVLEANNPDLLTDVTSLALLYAKDGQPRRQSHC